VFLLVIVNDRLPVVRPLLRGVGFHGPVLSVRVCRILLLTFDHNVGGVVDCIVLFQQTVEAAALGGTIDFVLDHKCTVHVGAFGSHDAVLVAELLACGVRHVVHDACVALLDCGPHAVHLDLEAAFGVDIPVAVDKPDVFAGHGRGVHLGDDEGDVALVIACTNVESVCSLELFVLSHLRLSHEHLNDSSVVVDGSVCHRSGTNQRLLVVDGQADDFARHAPGGTLEKHALQIGELVFVHVCVVVEVAEHVHEFSVTRDRFDFFVVVLGQTLTVEVLAGFLHVNLQCIGIGYLNGGFVRRRGGHCSCRIG